MRVNGLWLAGMIMLFFFGAVLLNDRLSGASAAQLPEPAATALPAVAPEPVPTADPAAVRYPYDEFILTQGPHGQSYGQLAIDLTAGNGAPILSPISGTVTALYIDEYNNTTLVLDNEIWQVLLLHGDYSVQPGQAVSIGQVIGSESNHGYTLDCGATCATAATAATIRTSSYSINAGQNVNPLEVLARLRGRFINKRFSLRFQAYIAWPLTSSVQG